MDVKRDGEESTCWSVYVSAYLDDRKRNGRREERKVGCIINAKRLNVCWS
jgi:hypothetical protein